VMRQEQGQPVQEGRSLVVSPEIFKKFRELELEDPTMQRKQQVQQQQVL
jgi:hypothetical protein